MTTLVFPVLGWFGLARAAVLVVYLVLGTYLGSLSPLGTIKTNWREGRVDLDLPFAAGAFFGSILLVEELFDPEQT